MASPSTPATTRQNPIDPTKTPIIDGTLLEVHKENIAPTREGRSAAALSQIFSVSRVQRANDLAASHAYYKRLISDAQDDDEDPLDAYVQYVKWTVDNYPCGRSTESGLLKLLEEATRKFKDDPMYQTDVRYCKLWRQYATHVEQPERIYGFMLANDIGTALAWVYEEYAIALERNGNRKKADQIYTLGIHRKPRGYDRLQIRYNEFLIRMLTASSLPEPAPAPAPPPTNAPSSGNLQFGKRSALGTRSVSAPVPQSSRGDVFTDAPRSGHQSNRGRIAVFSNAPADEDAQLNDWPQLDTKAAANKENSKDATPWKGETLHQAIPATPRTPKIPIYRDEDVPSTPCAPGASPDTVFQRSRKGPSESEALVQNPFMLYEPGVVTDFELPPGPSIPPPAPVSKAPQSTPPAQPPKPQATAADPNKTIAPRPKALTAPSASSSGASVPSTSTSGKRPEKLRINLDLLYSNSQEYCINEARAHSLGLLGKSNWPAPPPREHSVPLKEDGETTRGDAGASRRLSKGKEKTATRRAGSPTITFNTKAALADIEVFFNSPKKGERGDESSADDDDEDEGRNVVEVPRKLAPEGGRATPTPLGVSTGRAFVPFVDQNAMPPPPPSSNKENEFARAPTTQPAGPSKIPIFQADEESSTTPGPPGRIKPNPFTPLGEKRLPSTLRPLTSTQQPKPQTFVPHVDEVPPTTSRKPAPLQEHPPDNVFGTAKEDAAEVPPTPTPGGSFPARLFTCYSEEGQKPDSRETEQQEGLRSYSPQDPPTRATAAETRSIFTANPPSEASDEAGATAEEEQYYEEDENEVPPEDDGEENVEQVYDDEDEDYRAPLGRFGQFNVMTPITERTFEFTTTRAWTSTSGEGPRFSDYASDNGEDTGRLLTDGIADDVTSGSQFLTSELPPFSEPCNPFEPSTVTSLISLIEPQYNDHRHVDSKHLETLEKFAKKQTRRPSGSMMAVSRADGLPIMLGAEEFTVMEKLGEGGFGAVFLAENSTLAKAKEENLDETFNEDDDGDAFLVALKVVRPRQIWEYAVLGRIHSTLPSPVLPSIISPRGLYVFKDESFLVLDYCRQGTLLDCVNHASQFGVGSALPGGGIDELLAVFFTIELLKLLDALHSAGFIHGDVKIDNCLLRLEEVVEGANAWAVVYDPTGANGWAYKGIRMIDFGRAIDTTFFTPGQQFVGDWPTDERDCVELREGRPWTYQTDYWGLASIIHCMLFGKYIETTAVIDSSSDTPQTRYRITAPLKRYWQTDIWNPLFDLLLNPNVARSDGSLPLTQELEDVRTEMEDWLKVNCDKGGKSLKGFLKKIERATLDRTLAR